MSPAVASLGSGPELNILVVGGGQDTWLEAVADKVDNEDRASSEGDVVDAIVNLASTGQTFSAIELISHTGADNLLRFGSWSLGPGAFASAGAQFGGILRSIGIVRLAGCYSACGDAASRALRHLESTFNVQAEGTIRGIGTRHLSSSGTIPAKRPGLFVPASQAMPSAAMHGFDAAKSLADLGEQQVFEASDLLVRLSSEPQAALAAALAITGSTCFDAPGLLRMPDLWLELRDTARSVVAGIGLMFDAEVLHLEVVGVSGGAERVFAVPAEKRSELRKLLESYGARSR